MRHAKARAIKHIEIMVEMYREQMEDGHCFLHEHLALALWGQLTCMEGLMGEPQR